MLGAVFLVYAVRIYIDYSDELARRTFRYSIVYLTLLFAALLVDHYLRCLSEPDDESSLRAVLLARWLLPGAGCGSKPKRRAFKLDRHHRRRLRQGLRADRPQRQAAHAGRFPRQGGGGVLRLHALPGRLPDDARARWRR